MSPARVVALSLLSALAAHASGQELLLGSVQSGHCSTVVSSAKSAGPFAGSFKTQQLRTAPRQVQLTAVLLGHRVQSGPVLERCVSAAAESIGLANLAQDPSRGGTLLAQRANQCLALGRSGHRIDLAVLRAQHSC